MRPSELGKVKGWQGDALTLSNEVEKEEAEVERIRKAHEMQQAALNAKAAAAELASEASRGMSAEGVCTLVSLRLSLEHRFVNTSDVNSRVWEHIHAQFMKKVSDGTIASSDGRSWQALSKRCARAPANRART